MIERLLFVLLPCSLAFMGHPPCQSRRSTSLSMSAALIVQNKGGGHGELGYQLAKKLSSNNQITSITILQDSACKADQEPFKSYSTDLPNVAVIMADLGDESMTAPTLNSILQNKRFDYVWDNASKGPVGAGKAVCDLAKTWTPSLFVYVSSAGMYTPDETTTFPMPETTPKKNSGQFQFEEYAAACNLPLVAFRPQYIYGPKSNKYSYLDWYFDRLVNDVPLPIPGNGRQLVSLTNSEDVASLLTSPLNNPQAAIQQRYFNCGTDQLLSYDQVADLCAKSCDKQTYRLEHYNVEFGKANFPFRLENFYVAPSKAKELLNWEGPQHSLQDDLEWYWEGYQARGGPSKTMDFTKDEEIFAATG